MRSGKFNFAHAVLITAAALTVPASTSASDFVDRQQSQASSRLASMDAAIAHQKMVLEALNTLQSEGRSAPQEVAVAQNTLNVLNSERELIQQMVAALKTVTLLEESAGENVDTIVLPIPVVKDLYNASAISHVSYRLHDDATRNAAAEIQTLIAELQKHEASARHTLLGERHRRISELNDPSTIRERELLSLRQAAYKAATIADISNLPILAHSTQQYRLGNETVGGEVALIRIVAENATRLRFATQLSQQQHRAELWQHNVSVLAQVAGADAFAQRELDHARSGADYFQTQVDRLNELSGNTRFIFASTHTSPSPAALQSELNDHSLQQAQRQQQAVNKCLSWYGLAEKLKLLSTQDSYFAGELAAVQRSLTVAQAEAAAVRHADEVHAGVMAFVESVSSTDDTTVIKSSALSTAQALRNTFRLAAEKSREVQVVNSQIAVAEVRVQALQVLQNEGFASWWETEPAKAALQDLQTEVQRLKLIGRINALSLQIVEQSEPILSTDRTLAMSP